MNHLIIPLNREWKYAEKFSNSYINKDVSDDCFKNVQLPHTNKEIPYNCFDEKMYQFISCYRKTFSVSKEYKGKRVFVDFEGVMTYAKVYINGVELGEHKGGYTPFSFDLTDHLIYGDDNLLTVMVDSTERKDIPPFGFVIDYLCYGGIYREVNLRIVEDCFIQNIFAKPGKVLEEKKALSTEIYVHNKGNEQITVQAKVQLLNNDTVCGESVSEAVLEANDKSKLILNMDGLMDIELWGLENPHLYTVKATLLTNETELHSYEVKVGFRQAEFKSEGFYLNGERVKIRGLNRHQSFPYVGYAMPKRVQCKDADILKNELGLNLARTSHYPQSRHFLDRCDEIGLLVFEEIPGWQHIGDVEWQEVACNNVREMIERDWNHPSIILWGVRINESNDSHEFYLKTNDIAHKLDDTRQTGGVRCIPNSELLEDVYTMNDFNLDGVRAPLLNQQEVTGLDHDVPYLVTEYNGHMYPTKRFDQEERLNEHALRHAQVQNEMQTHDNIAGAIGWCAFDYNTHYEFGSGDRICYHGVMDMFRIPKFASYVYKSQLSPSKKVVLEPITLWARGERDECGVLPMTILTNCDSIEVITCEESKKYFPDKEQFPGLEYPPVTIHHLDQHQEWGSSWDDITFVGYVGDKEVAKKTFAKNPVPVKLEVKADDLSLNSGDMDATRIVYKIVDQKGNVMPFINECINFEIEGEGEIIGPKSVGLIGGCIAVWVKTTGSVGKITMKASCSRFSAEDVLIQVSE